MGAYPVWHDETELMNYIEKEAFAAATATTTFLGHFECKRCDRAFSSRSAREQHLEASAQILSALLTSKTAVVVLLTV